MLSWGRWLSPWDPQTLSHLLFCRQHESLKRLNRKWPLPPHPHPLGVEIHKEEAGADIAISLEVCWDGYDRVEVARVASPKTWHMVGVQKMLVDRKQGYVVAAVSCVRHQVQTTCRMHACVRVCEIIRAAHAH